MSSNVRRSNTARSNVLAVQLKEKKEKSPLVWSSRWATYKRNGPRHEFRELYKLEQPLKDGEEPMPFFQDSLMEDDIVLVESSIVRYPSKGAWVARFDLQALYWLDQPDVPDVPSPVKKVKKVHI